MCGRTCCLLHPNTICHVANATAIDPNVGNYKPRYNFSPKSSAPIAYDAPNPETGEYTRVVAAANWGLVPFFAKQPDARESGYKMINARIEKMEESSIYRRLVKSHRCVVFADGFYEWKKESGGKQPMYFRVKDSVPLKPIPLGAKSQGTTFQSLTANKQKYFRPLADLTIATDKSYHKNDDHQPMMFAGLYDVWIDKANEDAGRFPSFTILTMSSAGTPMAAIHDRMPVMVDASTASRWLAVDTVSPEATVHEVAETSKRLMRNDIAFWPVGAEVGNVANESPSLIEPTGRTSVDQERQTTISDFFKVETKKESAPASAARPTKKELPQERSGAGKKSKPPRPTAQKLAKAETEEAEAQAERAGVETQEPQAVPPSVQQKTDDRKRKADTEAGVIMRQRNETEEEESGTLEAGEAGITPKKVRTGRPSTARGRGRGRGGRGARARGHGRAARDDY